MIANAGIGLVALVAIARRRAAVRAADRGRRPGRGRSASCVAVAWVIAVQLVAATLTGILQIALYRFATDGDVARASTTTSCAARSAAAPTAAALGGSAASAAQPTRASTGPAPSAAAHDPRASARGRCARGRRPSPSSRSRRRARPGTSATTQPPKPRAGEARAERARVDEALDERVELGRRHLHVVA